MAMFETALANWAGPELLFCGGSHNLNTSLIDQLAILEGRTCMFNA
jgi:hypothetical protein